MPVFGRVRKSLTFLYHHDATRLMGAASFVFFYRIIGSGIVFATHVLLARWTGPEELGLYVYAFSLCTLLATVAGLGLPTAVFRFIGKGVVYSDSNLVVSFSRFGRYVTAAASILIAAIGIALIEGMNHLAPSGNQKVLLVALGSVPIYALIRWYSSLANALSAFHVAFLPRVVLRPLLLLVVVYFLLLLDFNISAIDVMFINMGAMAIILVPQCMVVERFMYRRFHNMRSYRYEGLYWIRLALPQLITSVILNSFFEVNVIVAGAYLPPDQLAIFNASFRTALIVTFGIQAVDVITAPRVAKLYAAGDTVALQRTVLRSTYIKSIGSFGSVIVLALFGRSILSLFGPEFIVGYYALILIAFSQFIIASIGMGVQLLNVSGHQDEGLAVFLCSAILMVGLHAFLVPRFGIEGAAIAVVAVAVVQSWWLKTLVERRLNIFPAVTGLRMVLRKKSEEAK